MDDRLLLAQIDVGITRLEKSMRRAGVSVDGAAKKMATRWEKNNRKMSQSSKVSARAINASLGSIGIGAALAVTVRTIAQFKQSMSTVQAITGATGEQFGALEDKARSLGATTRFSASEAAEGMIALGRAGFDTDQVLASIEGTLLLAQSGALELGQAADIASNVLQGFQLGAEESARAVDVLSLAANSSNTNVEQLGQALSFVAPAAAAVGVSLEDTTAAVSVLSNAGIQATRAGTGLRKIFIDLASKGHDFSEEAGGVEGILKRLNKEFGNLGKEQRLVAASDLVGARQAASLLVLLDSVKDGTGQLATLGEAYENAGGSAKKFAAIMDDNLNGALLATKSRLEEMVISLGEAGGEQALIDALQKLQDILVYVAENADTFNKAIIILTASMAGLIGGKALAGGIIALKGFSKSLVAANVAAGTSTLSIRGLTVATRTFLLALGPIGLITLAAGAIAALAVNTKSSREEFEAYDDTLRDITKANDRVKTDTEKLKTLHEELTKATIAGGEAAIFAKGAEINAVNERIAKNKELLKLKGDLLKEQLSAGKDRTKELEEKQLKTASGSVSTRNISDEQAERHIKTISDSIKAKTENDIALTKQEKKFRDVRLQIIEHNIAMEQARLRVDDLNAAIEGGGAAAEPFVPNVPTPDLGGSSSGKLSDDEEKAKARREKALEAIREIGKAEIEQIEELQAKRIAQIAESQKAGEVSVKEAAKLRVAVTKEAEAEIKAIRDKTSEEEIQNASDVRLAKADEFQLIAEIAAASARVHGRALDATQIELDATRARYQAELDDIDRVAQARAEAGLEADPQLAANRADAQAGIANVDADQRDFIDGRRENIQGVSDGAEGEGLASELSRLQIQQDEKLRIIAEFYNQDKELEAAYLAEKEQIEDEFNEKRKQARLADISSQLDAASKLTATIGKIGKEGSKAQKAAAKVQQGIALGRAGVNAAMSISEAVASAPFPANIPAIAFATAVGGAQIAAIASQGFKDGVVDLQGPGTTTSDSINARLSRGESVIKATATRGNEAGLRGLNAGLSPEQAFGLPNIQTPNIARPNVSVPRLNNVSNSSTNNSFRDGDFVVQGNIDATSADQVMAELKAYKQAAPARFRAMTNLREKNTTPRTERPRVGRR